MVAISANKTVLRSFDENETALQVKQRSLGYVSNHYGFIQMKYFGEYLHRIITTILGIIHIFKVSNRKQKIMWSIIYDNLKTINILVFTLKVQFACKVLPKHSGVIFLFEAFEYFYDKVCI